MREEERSRLLDRIWEAYRKATPEPEPSVNFMPELWARIDSNRPMSWTLPLTRLAARLLPLAAAATVAMGLYVWNPTAADPLVTGYVDVLAADMIEQQQPALWMVSGEDRI